MKGKILGIALVLCALQQSLAQFTLDGEFRPRTEYRHGFGSLISESDDAGFATSTRARLNAGYATESYQFYLSLQDIMVWGENRQLKPEDVNNSFSVFEAWAEIKLGEGFTSKIGRQTLVYDDQRIMGSVDWAQQARSHDAALIRFKEGGFMTDLGLAFNQDFDDPGGFQSVGTTYNTTGFFSYKTMQYLYLKQQWQDVSMSLLAMNNGFQNFTEEGAGDGISNLTTIGTHINYGKGKLGAAFNGFFQTGERQNELKVGGAYLLGLDVKYKAAAKLAILAGVEIISGNNADTADKTEAFFPLYGTNHKFNGFMDYFYVGNHANTIGLFDVHAGLDINFNEKCNLMVKALHFSGQQELASGEKSLGTELDLVLQKKFNGYSLSIGYSQMFASDGMYELKGVLEDNAAKGQNWAWVMLSIKPKFLNSGNM